MKRTKEEILQTIREHGGDTPDDFTISMLEDIADSFVDVVETVDTADELATLTEAHENLQKAYDALKKSYADRFVLKEDEIETKTEEEKEEEAAESVDSYDSIFD